MSADVHGGSGTRVAGVACVAVAWAALAGACAAREPTELMLRIHTDLPAAEMPAYDLTVAWADTCGRRAVFQGCYERTGDVGGNCPAPDPQAGSTGTCAAGTRFDPGPFRRDPFRPSAAAGQWEVSHGIVPARSNEPGVDLSRPLVITARGYLGGREIVATGEVFASFDRDHLRYVDVYLFRHCIGVDCPAGQICTPAASCGQTDGGADPDAALDAGDDGAPTDVPASCDAAACSAGAQRCVAGTVQRCALDAFACPRWTTVTMCASAMCDMAGVACCDLARTCAGRHCGVDGCGRSCGTCAAGLTCNTTTGQCGCPGGTPTCNGRCCPAGATCSADGTACVCPGGGTLCGAACCTATQTCVAGTLTCCERGCTGAAPCMPDRCGGFCGCGPYGNDCQLVGADVACFCANSGLCPPPGSGLPATDCCAPFQRCTFISAGTYACR